MTAQSIPADLLLSAIREAGVQDVVLVPDTHQRTVLDLLMADDEIRTVHCSTEDEANAIAAGLYIGGAEVALMIQHAGLYASVNTLRGVGLDGGVPLFALVGLLSREPELEPKDSPRSMVRFAGPLMDTFDVPHALLETRDDLGLIPEYYALSRERSGPAVVFVGRETA